MDSAVESITSIFPETTRLKRGLCPIPSPTPGGPSHALYYELHGSALPTARRVLFVMGLNNSSFAWENQVAHFAAAGYQVLVFDNRGVGHSETPAGRWTIKAMAADTSALLDAMGWTEERSIHLVGVSMGGMIALELALLIPEHIATLSLTSTKSGASFDLPSLRAVTMFSRLLTGMFWNAEHAMSLVVDTLYPQAWLDAIDPEGKDNATRRGRVNKDFIRRYKVGKVQSFGGKLGQLDAVSHHRVTETQLALIAKTIPRVAIITGDDDALVNPARSQELHDMMEGSTLKVVAGAGHALPSQIKEDYNAWLESVFTGDVVIA